MAVVGSVTGDEANGGRTAPPSDSAVPSARVFPIDIYGVAFSCNGGAIPFDHTELSCATRGNSPRTPRSGSAPGQQPCCSGLEPYQRAVELIASRDLHR